MSSCNTSCEDSCWNVWGAIFIVLFVLILIGLLCMALSRRNQYHGNMKSDAPATTNQSASTSTVKAQATQAQATQAQGTQQSQRRDPVRPSFNTIATPTTSRQTNAKLDQSNIDELMRKFGTFVDEKRAEAARMKK